MRQLVYICLLLLFLIPRTSAQDKTVFKKTFIAAEEFFMMGEYHDAIYLFEELLKTDPDNSNLHFLLAASYLSLHGEKDKAIPHLEIAVEEMSPSYREGSYKERSAPREALFALARAYHINGEFDRAIELYESYRAVMIKKHFADIEYVNNQIKSCELAKSMVKRPVDVQFLSLGEEVNKFPSNYNPVVSLDDSTLIYMIDQPERMTIIMINRKPDGGWTEPVIINDELGCQGNCYPTSISANGKELYLAVKQGWDSDIYISYLKNGQFTEMIPLNRNINTDYNETHACISFNGKWLYFTSDRPGGRGGLDIWVSQTNPEGDWDEPVNLGPRVNSHYSEETPFLTSRGDKLYFSSQGHATMGGFDYFVSDRLSKEEKELLREVSGQEEEEPLYDDSWSNPENLGYPISTADDDLFYYPRKGGSGAYYAGIIEDISPTRSIYTVRRKEDEAQIAARRQGEDDPVVDQGIRTGVTGETAQTTETTETAEATETPETDEQLAETAVDPVTGEVPVSTGTTKPTPTAEAERPVLEARGPAEYVVKNSIQFGFDSDELDEAAKREADRVLEVLLNNPGVDLQLTGHTDAIGADEYNLRLSERRAKAVADYLYSKGVERSRLRVNAAGEARPIAINQYEDGTDSPDGRRLNRQVSIKFENLQSDNVRMERIFVPDHLKPVADQSYSVLLLRSDIMIDTIPDEVNGEQTALIITDSAFLYTAGNFNHKTQAMRYLNEVVDIGYPDANMLEEDDLARLIASLSEEGIRVTASYTIQIMALKNPVEVSYFEPLTPVTRYTGRDGFHRYVYGEFDSLAKALEVLPELKRKGYQDAFIMSILRYERLSQ